MKQRQLCESIQLVFIKLCGLYLHYQFCQSITLLSITGAHLTTSHLIIAAFTSQYLNSALFSVGLHKICTTTNSIAIVTGQPQNTTTVLLHQSHLHLLLSTNVLLASEVPVTANDFWQYYIFACVLLFSVHLWEKISVLQLWTHIQQ